jgi:sigma-54 dependent transcriptional regulator of gfr operon
MFQAHLALPFVEVGITADVGSENLVQSNLFGHVRGAFTGAEDEKQGLFALADAVVRVNPAVERLSVMNSTRIELALILLLQERAALRSE